MTGAGQVLAAETAEQPAVLARLLERWLPRLDELREALRPDDLHGIVVAARGSSDNAARYAQYLWPLWTGLPVRLATPSLRTVYGRSVDLAATAVVAVSQSGSSPDVVGALADARGQGRPGVAVTNDPASDLAARASTVLALEAGPERAVAATKTYTASLLAVALLGVALLGADARRRAVAALEQVPEAVQGVLDRRAGVDAAAALLAAHDRAITVGRGINLSTAHEVALKLTELTGALVAPFSPADLLHGPVAAVGPDTPAVLVCPPEPATADVVAAAAQLRRRGAPVVAIVGADDVGVYADLRLRLGAGPADAGVAEWLTPLTAVLPGQLVAARAAVLRGVDVDRPGGLSKVTRTR